MARDIIGTKQVYINTIGCFLFGDIKLKCMRFGLFDFVLLLGVTDLIPAVISWGVILLWSAMAVECETSHYLSTF